MIVRNEASVLPATLSSLEPLRERAELVVVDTGSTDDTIAILVAAGARVIQDPWRDDFSYSRNRAFQEAQGDYALVLDADERLEPESIPKLLAFAEKGQYDRGLARVIDETDEGLTEQIQVRVCRGDGNHKYIGRIHEQLVGPGTAGATGLVIRHVGYKTEEIARKDKLARNARLIRAELTERPDDAYLHYQLARTLVRQDPLASLDVFARAVSTAPDDAGFLPSAVREYGHALRAAGRPADARTMLAPWLTRFSDFTDLWFLDGLLALDLGDAHGMLAAFNRCIALGETSRYSTVKGVGSFRAHHNLGLFFELLGDRTRASQHYEQALATNASFAPTLERLSALR